MKVWCMKWIDPFANRGHPTEGWCACKANECPHESQGNVPTLCGWFVVLTGRPMKRTPTCPECLAKLKERKRAMVEPITTDHDGNPIYIGTELVSVQYPANPYLRVAGFDPERGTLTIERFNAVFVWRDGGVSEKTYPLSIECFRGSLLRAYNPTAQRAGVSDGCVQSI